MAGRTKIAIGFTGTAALFLPLFVFLQKLLQRAMKAEVDAVILVTQRMDRNHPLFAHRETGTAG